MLRSKLTASLVAGFLWLVPIAAWAACPAGWQPGSFSSVEGAQLEVLQQICANQSGGGAGYQSSAAITRTNDTNVYAANDVIGAATGATAAVQFSNIGPSGGGQVMITSSRLRIDAAAVISGETSYNLYCYNVTPPSALGDNAAFDIPSGDRSSTVVKIALGTPVDEGSTLSIRSDGINSQITVPSGGSLFCYLVTVGTYTPTASRVYNVTLHAIGL